MNWSLLGLLRFALAFIVACSHVIYFDRSPFALAVASLGSKAAVVGFLLVSGFSIAASFDRNREGFYFRRFKRIYPVYLVTVAVGIGLEYGYGAFSAPFYEFQPTGALSAIGSLLMLQTFLVKSTAYNPVIWSLAVECAFYAITPFIFDRARVIMAMCAISIAFYLLPDGNHGLLYTAALKANAIKYFWPFGFGLLMYMQKTSTPTVIACAIIGGLATRLSHLNYEPYAVGTYLVSVTTIFVASRHKAKSAMMDYLGDISYPLYLVQFPVFIIAFKAFGITSSYELLVITVLMSIAIYEVVDVRIKPLIFKRRTLPPMSPAAGFH